MNIVPIEGKIIAKEQKEAKTSTGIILTQENPTTLIYEVVGSKVENITKGCLIYVSPRNGAILEVDGKIYKVFSEAEILAIENK